MSYCIINIARVQITNLLFYLQIFGSNCKFKKGSSHGYPFREVSRNAFLQISLGL